MTENLSIEMVISAKDAATSIINQASDALNKLTDELNKMTNSSSSINALSDSFKILGIKSSAAMDEMRQKINAAYQNIAESAETSANDIIRAEKAKNEKIKAIEDELAQGIKQSSANVVASALFKYNQIAEAVQRVFSTVKGAVSDAVTAVDDYQSYIVKMAATITSMKGPTTDVAESYRQSKEYATNLAQKLIEIDQNTIASAKDLRAMTEEMSKQGVYLDLNNKKQIESFQNIANAVAVIAKGYGESEMQVRQEIRSLLKGQVDMNSQLASQVDAMTHGSLKEQVEIWKEEGTLIENIGNLLMGFAAATGDINSLWSTLASTIQTIYESTLRDGFAPTMAVIVEQVQKMADWFKENDTVSQGLHKTLTSIKGILETAWNILQPFTPFLVEAGKWVAFIADGWGMIASVYLPTVSKLLKDLSQPFVNIGMSVIELGKSIGSLFTFDNTIIEESTRGLVGQLDKVKESFASFGKADYLKDFEKNYDAYQNSIKKKTDDTVSSVKLQAQTLTSFGEAEKKLNAQLWLEQSDNATIAKENQLNALKDMLRGQEEYKNKVIAYGKEAGEAWVNTESSRIQAVEKANDKASANAAKKAETELERARKQAEAFANAWESDLAGFNTDIAVVGMSKLEAEFTKIDAKAAELGKKWADMPGAIEKISQRAEALKLSAILKQETEDQNKLLNALEKENAQRKQNEAAIERQATAMRSMYKDMGETAQGFFDGEYALIKQQSEHYKAMGIENDLVNQWYQSQYQKIYDKQVLTTDNFFEGVKKGYRDLQKEAMTWAKAGEKIVKDFASKGTTAISDGLFDIITGKCEDLADVWKSLWQGMLKTMTDIIAKMMMNDLLKMFFGVQTSGGLTLSLVGGDKSATGTATSALSLASLVKGLADLPATIAAIPTKLLSAVVSVGEALGIVSASASATSSAVLGLGTSASVAGTALSSTPSTISSVMVESQLLDAALATTTSSTTAMATAAKTSVASFEAIDSALMSGGASSSISMAGLIGPAAALAVGYFISSGEFDKLIGGLLGYESKSTSNAEMDSALRAFEAGTITLDKSTADFYKSVLLFQNFGENFNKSFADESDAWIAANQELLTMTMAEYDKLMGQQQTAINTATWDTGSFWAASPELAKLLSEGAYVEVGVKIAQDATIPVEEKMYQLGFIASETGWESDAVIKMIAEFKNQGVAWEDINNALINYGATDADVYKKIYAEYHGDSVLTDLNSLTAALSAEGISEDVLKTIKYIYSANIPLDEMQALLEWAGLSSEEAARIVGQIDPSDEWKDLVIPVDAPDSIPVDYSSMGGRASGGPVSAGNPYIIGEVGPELFIPQESGHILSNANMRKLMGMGVRGYADGTTDPLPGTPDWWAANPPSDSDINGNSSSSDTSTYKDISEWLDDYNEKLKEWLGTGNDLSDQLDSLNKFYTEQIGYANDLQASQEQLDQLSKDQQKAKEKILQDWLNDEIDYYNEAMGLNTALGDSLQEISTHYATAIEEAKSAGATEEQLGEIRKAQSEVTTKALQDWLAGEMDYYNQMMGLNTELGDKLAGISEHYKNTIAEATAAGATEAQLAEIRKAASEVTTKALQDWLDGETDYYNEMMGNTSALGKTLDEINSHYENTIAEAKSAGATEEQLAEIRKAQSEVAQKAIQDEYDAFVDYYNEMMGNTNELQSQIDEVTKKFDEYKKSLLAIDPNADLSGLNQALQDIIDKLSADYWDDYADKVDDFMGVSNDYMKQIEDINDFFKKAYDAAAGNATLQKQIMSDWEGAINYSLQSMITSYQAQVNKWLGVSQTQEEAMQAEIYNYFYMIYAFAAALKADQATLDKIIADYQAVSQRNKDTHGEMGGTPTTDTTPTDNGFSSALSDFTSELQSYVDELKSLVESITSKIDDIRYSSLNPYLTVSSKMAMAQGDYQKLFAAAKTGSAEDVQKYLAFVETYLQSAQNQYKSSTMYQQIYQQVMKDLGIIQGSTQTKLTKSEELLDKLNTNAVNSYAVLNDIKTILWNIQQGTQSSTAGAMAIDSYGSVAGITSARNDNTNEDNKKIVSLLEGIYMAQNKPQRVELVLDNGERLSGYVKTVADGVYVERSSRPGMAQRRIYQ